MGVELNTHTNMSNTNKPYIYAEVRKEDKPYAYIGWSLSTIDGIKRYLQWYAETVARTDLTAEQKLDYTSSYINLMNSAIENAEGARKAYIPELK